MRPSCVFGLLPPNPFRLSLTAFPSYFLLLKRSQHEPAALQRYVKIFANKVVLLSGEIVCEIKPRSFILQGRSLQSNLLI